MVKITPRPRRPLPERPVLIQSGELVLEGLYIRKNSEDMPALLSSPHPQFGGSMDSPYINELAYALARAEVASLRYNYRGVGASQGQWSEGKGELEDLAAAADVLLETFYAEQNEPAARDLVLAGYSFGSWLSLRQALNDRRVQRLLLVAPPINKEGYDFSALPNLRMQVGILVGDKDTFCPTKVLEKFLRDLSKKHPKWKPPEVYIVPEASHFFVRGLSNAGAAGARFLRTGHFAGENLPGGNPNDEIDLA